MSSFESFFVNYGLWASYILIVLGVASIIIFSIYHLVQNPKKSIMSIIGFLVIIALFLITYFLATDYTTKPDMMSSGMVKLIGSGLFSLYVLLALSVIGIIVGEITSFFK